MNRLLRYIGLVFILLAVNGLASAKSYKVSNVQEYNVLMGKLVPGDTVILTNGKWMDASLVFTGVGTAQEPITLTVESKGQVTLQGKSSLKIHGEYLHVSGLVFVNGYTDTKFVIEFKSGSKLANNCRVSHCVVDNYNQPNSADQDTWLSLWGKNNTVEYCYFGGKTNQGPTFIVWPNDSSSTDNHHHIYRNYFGYRDDLGNNGGETMRIGTSDHSQKVSATRVEQNYFEHCNGEIEIISIKSCENLIQSNTFFECQGTVTLRHGHRNHIDGNFFIGNHKALTGGVRIINEGHQITNNLFYKLAGTGFRAPLSILNGIPNSPLNGYARVKDVVVGNNTFFDCTEPWLFNGGIESRNRVESPENTLLTNNLVFSTKQQAVTQVLGDASGIKMLNNVAWLANGLYQSDGFVPAHFTQIPFKSWFVPVADVASVQNSSVEHDITGRLRSDANAVGAFGSKQTKADVFVPAADNCGPLWYQPQIKKQPQAESASVIEVPAEEDALLKALKTAVDGDVFELLEGVHKLSKKLSLDKKITIKASASAKSKPVLRFSQTSSTISMVELKDGALLTLDNVDLDGNAQSDYAAKYGFTTYKESMVKYSLVLRNCEIYGFTNEDGGGVFKAYPGSLADSIVLDNCIVRDCYRGFALSADKDNPGGYNAEHIAFYNTVFKSVKQWGLEYYTGSEMIESFKGKLTIDHCVFDDVNSFEGQVILRTKGIDSVSVTNSIFVYSLAKNPIVLVGPNQFINNCCVFRSGQVSAKAGAQISGIMDVNPKFEKGSYHLSEKSPLLKAGSEGTNIGLKKLP